MASKSLFIAFLAFAAGINAGDSVGLVGLGRKTFEPLCCYACLSSLWGLAITCPEAQIATLERSVDPFCHATSTIYLSSLAYCMQTQCQADDVESSAVEQCWMKVAGDGVQVSSLEDNLPATTPTFELGYNATSLNEISLINGQYYQDSRATIQGAAKQESARALYGLIIILVVVGFCLILGLHRLKSYYLPMLSSPRIISSITSKYITEPALIGTAHLKRLPWNIGYVPSRNLSLLIISYVGLNAILSAINYPTQTPDTWYISSSKQRISWISNRLGVLSLANVAIAIMFSGRNTPLLWITGASRTDILTFHRWVARIAAVQAIVHVALYGINTSRSGYKMFTIASDVRVVNYNPSYWTFGVIAVIGLFFLVFIFSVLLMRVKFYETFLVIHIVFVIAILVALWNHIGLRFHKAYGYEVWLYIAFAFWGFDRLIRPIRILLLNWRSWISPGFPKSTVELLPGDEFMKITVFPSLIWDFTAGQHCFLYFPTIGGNPFQSHPFSIAGWSHGLQHNDNNSVPFAMQNKVASALPSQTKAQTDDNQGMELQNIPLQPTHQESSLSPSRPRISFIIRPQTGLTKSLHKRLLLSSKRTIPLHIPVFIEGPYGPSPPPSLHQADTVIAVAGGIGITSILGYLQLYLEKPAVVNVNENENENEQGESVQRREETANANATRFLLVWSVREESLVEAVSAQIGDVEELRRRGVEVQIVRTGKGDESERMDVRMLVRDEVKCESDGLKRVCVVSCGPGGMADEVRSAVVDCIGSKGVKVDLVEEAFCW